MSINKVNHRIQPTTVGKAQARKKSGRTSNAPQDTVTKGASYSKPGGDLQELKRQEHQARKEANLSYANNKTAAHVAGAGTFMGTIGTMSLKYPDGRWNLKALATKAVEQYDLAADYPEDVKAELKEIVAAAKPNGVYQLPEDAKKPWVKDYRDKPFVSIDNGTLWTEMDPEKLAKDPEANVSSRDIDQLQTIERIDSNNSKVIVAVSDIDAYVKKGSAIDRFMDVNTSSIYTPDKVFNLVPPELAEDLASLNPREERLSTVISYTVSKPGSLAVLDQLQASVAPEAQEKLSEKASTLLAHNKRQRAEAQVARSRGPELAPHSLPTPAQGGKPVPNLLTPEAAEREALMEMTLGELGVPEAKFNGFLKSTSDDRPELNMPSDLSQVRTQNRKSPKLKDILRAVDQQSELIRDHNVEQAIVKSRTKLDYDSVSAWMEGEADASPAIKAQGEEMMDNLKLQREVSDWIDAGRTNDLEVDRTETRIITENGNAVDVAAYKKGPANKIVENFMVTSNSAVSKFLRSKGYPTLERTLKPPEKWDRLQALAKDNGYNLPSRPDAAALTDYLEYYKGKNPEGYGDMAVSIFKLSGRGMYEAIGPKQDLPGQFFLGVKNYMQSTASIRRGGDRLTPRLLKAALAGEPSPYSMSELNSFADNLNDKGRVLNKAERMAEKMVVATMLEDRVGERFDAVVTGQKGKRKWCRIGDPPVEGSLYAKGNFDVGDKLKVKLSKINVEKGWIDFSQTR